MPGAIEGRDDDTRGERKISEEKRPHHFGIMKRAENSCQLKEVQEGDRLEARTKRMDSGDRVTVIVDDKKAVAQERDFDLQEKGAACVQSEHSREKQERPL